MLGIDKAMQQSAAQAAKVHQRFLLPLPSASPAAVQGKTWSLEDEGDDDEEDLSNAAGSASSVKREVASARETAMSLQADKQREAMERATQAAAAAAAACNNPEKAAEEDEEDPLDKYMEDIAKEVKRFRGNVAPAVTKKSSESAATLVKQEQATVTPKGSVVKVVTKVVKSEVSTKTMRIKRP